MKQFNCAEPDYKAHAEALAEALEEALLETLCNFGPGCVEDNAHAALAAYREGK